MLLKSPTFEGSIILSQAISGQATQMRCLMTIHLIDSNTLPLLYTQVSLHILHTLDSLLQTYFSLKRRRLVKDMTNFITLMLLDPYPNQRLMPSGAVCTSCHWFQMPSYLYVTHRMRNTHGGSHAVHFDVTSTTMHSGTNRKALQFCGSSTVRE